MQGVKGTSRLRANQRVKCVVEKNRLFIFGLEPFLGDQISSANVLSAFKDVVSRD
jgi:hypothetical protein